MQNRLYEMETGIQILIDIGQEERVGLCELQHGHCYVLFYPHSIMYPLFIPLLEGRQL